MISGRSFPDPRVAPAAADLSVSVSECPLTLAVQLEDSCELIKVLRSGGAHLDFRTRDGITALHRAVLCRNSTALMVRQTPPPTVAPLLPSLNAVPVPQTLLDLGASPDYKDSRGLTPLYHSAMVGGAPYCCELLLQDHASIGTRCYPLTTAVPC